MVDTTVKPAAAPAKAPAKAVKVADKDSKHVRPLKRHGRLFDKAVFSGYKRGLRNHHENQIILKIEGYRRKEHGSFYVGKRCLYVKHRPGSVCPQHPVRKTRLLFWGKVPRLHGNTGAVRARFNRNLPGHAIGHRIRIMLDPSRI